MSEEIDYNDITVKYLGSFIHSSCKQYALKHMSDNDFILLKDANMKKTHDVLIRRGKEKLFCTIKNSSSVKYDKFYEEKLIKIVERLSK